MNNAASHIAPTSFAAPPSGLNLPHSLELKIPLPSAQHAINVYRVMSVDKPLRPKDEHIAYRVSAADPSGSPSALIEILIHTSSVRHMRLVSNSVLDDVTLILETMDAFSSDRDIGSAKAQPEGATDKEFELNGTGRAG